MFRSSHFRRDAKAWREAESASGNSSGWPGPALRNRFFSVFSRSHTDSGNTSLIFEKQLLGVNYSSRLLFPKRIQKFLRFGFNFCFWESEIRSKITFWEQEFPASGNRVFPFPHTLWDQGKSCAKSPETASENRQKQWFWTFWEQESTASDNTNLSKIKEILQNKFKFKLILGSKFDPKMSEIF